MDPLPLYKGLLGPMIIRDPGETQPTSEFFVAFHSFQPAATGLDRPFYCMNGRAYAGNTPTLRAAVGDDVAFHVYGPTTTSTPSTSTATAGRAHSAGTSSTT